MSEKRTAEITLAAEPRAAHARRILSNPDVQQLRDELRAKGLTEAQFEHMISELAKLPGEWQQYRQTETNGECDSRREKIRKKARELAELLDDDPEIRSTQVHIEENDRISIIQGNSDTLLGEGFERISGHITDLIEQCFSPTWSTTPHKIGLESFVIHATFGFLESFLPWLFVTDRDRANELFNQGEFYRADADFYKVPINAYATGLIGKLEYDAFHRCRYPNREVAIVTSAVTDRTVNAERVSQVRESQRRRYWVD